MDFDRIRRAAAWLLVAATGLGASQASAAVSGMTRVATGLTLPVFATHAPGDDTRLFVVEKTGAIKIVDLTGTTPTTLATPFVTVPGVLTDGNNPNDERGLLGLAFHPNYATNGKFYVYASQAGFAGGDHASYVREFTVSSNPNVAGTSSSVVLRFTQPQGNHNGGWIGFSPNDGNLYIASGDGGGGNDTGTGHTSGVGNAQDITDNLLGKILRIDVNADAFPADANRNYAVPATNPFVGVSGDDEIWAYGLRNPYRNSFDRQTGDLWIGDVGQGAREEIDRQLGTAAGGANYGWRLREGRIQTPTSGIGGAAPPGAIDPIYDYPSDGSSPYGGNAVVGGYVYRGPDPTLQGRYFFGDSFPARVWSFDPATVNPNNPASTVQNMLPLLTPNAGTLNTPVSFGEDAHGNLYVLDLDGDVFRINTNAVIDGDYNADGVVDAEDYAVWTGAFGAAGGPADGNGDGAVNAADYVVWRDNEGARSTDPPGALLDPTPVPEPSGALLMLGLGGMLTLVTYLRYRFDHGALQGAVAAGRR